MLLKDEQLIIAVLIYSDISHCGLLLGFIIIFYCTFITKQYQLFGDDIEFNSSDNRLVTVHHIVVDDMDKMLHLTLIYDDDI